MALAMRSIGIIGVCCLSAIRKRGNFDISCQSLKQGRGLPLRVVLYGFATEPEVSAHTGNDH